MAEERLELDYVRRPQRSRRWRWRLTLAVAGLVAVLLVVAHVWPGETIYQAGPVSEAHALFGHDCNQCHDQAWRPGLRLFLGDELRSVSDAACQRCHAGPVHTFREAAHPSCASCHREHIHAAPLARVTDAHCTSCHRELDRHLAPGASTRYESRITSFSRDHPEFALWREADYRDPGTVRFNHAVHLDAERVLTLAGHDKHGVRKQLDCQACHTPDATGRYMQPIRYEKHCRDCHSLRVDVTGLPGDDQPQVILHPFRAEPAPHGPPPLVRAALRDRLLRLFKAFDRDKLGWTPRPAGLLLPGERRTPPITKEQHEWAHLQLREIERVLFTLDGGCRYCHTYGPDYGPGYGRGYGPDRVDGLPIIMAARVNERPWPEIGMSSRWLPHSRFDHKAHRFLQCTECHSQATTSRETSEVLLPRVAQCQSCHQPTNKVRSDCVACHTYHGAEHGVASRAASAPGAFLQTGDCVRVSPNGAAVNSQGREPLEEYAKLLRAPKGRQ